MSRKGLTCLCHFIFKSVATLYRRLPNMSKNSAPHEDKFEHAVWKLLKHPGLSIPSAMVSAKISKKDACCQRNRAPGHAPGSKAKQFILRDINNKTYFIQCNNQLELDNDYETA